MQMNKASLLTAFNCIKPGRLRRIFFPLIIHWHKRGGQSMVQLMDHERYRSAVDVQIQVHCQMAKRL